MKLIIIDIFGVIIPNLRGGSKKCIRKLHHLLSDKNITFDEFFERYNKFVIGSISSAEFWKDIEGDVKKIEKRYLDSYRLTDNLEKIVSPLKDGYRVVALSNHPGPWMKYIISKFNLDELFDKIYVSGEIGIKKPQEELFHKVIHDFNVRPTDCILVDDQNKNLIVASKLGFKTIRVATSKDPVIFDADFTIKSMSEIDRVISTTSC